MADEDTTVKKPLVRSLMDPSPSLAFDLVRRNEDGSETKYPFRCRLLRSVLMDDALEAAQIYAAKRKENERGHKDLYSEAQAVEAVWRSCVKVERSTLNGAQHDVPLFATPQQLRESLDSEEIAQLLNAHSLTKAFYSFHNLTEEGVEKIIDTLTDEFKGSYFLSQLDSEEWPGLIFILARLAQSWRPAATPTPFGSDSSSESTTSNLEAGTTGSSPLPAGHVTSGPMSGTNLPTHGQLSREQAKQIVKDQLGGTEDSEK